MFISERTNKIRPLPHLENRIASAGSYTGSADSAHSAVSIVS